MHTKGIPYDGGKVYIVFVLRKLQKGFPSGFLGSQFNDELSYAFLREFDYMALCRTWVCAGRDRC